VEKNKEQLNQYSEEESFDEQMKDTDRQRDFIFMARELLEELECFGTGDEFYNFCSTEELSTDSVTPGKVFNHIQGAIGALRLEIKEQTDWFLIR